MERYYFWRATCIPDIIYSFDWCNTPFVLILCTQYLRTLNEKPDVFLYYFIFGTSEIKRYGQRHATDVSLGQEKYLRSLPTP